MPGKTRNRSRADRLPLRCRISHANGQISVVNPKEFHDNLQRGNLIQSARQRRADRFLAYVLPGLVAYRAAIEAATLKADDRPGAMLVFEAAEMTTRDEIELRLINEFDFPPENAERIAQAITRKREMGRALPGGPRAGNVWEGLYLAHILRSGVLPAYLAEQLRQKSEPLLIGDPLIEGDPSTAFALW